jgi:hypothetical protein
LSLRECRWGCVFSHFSFLSLSRDSRQN